MITRFQARFVVLATFVVAVGLVALAASTAFVQNAEAAQFGSFEPVSAYTFETIVDETGGFEADLPGNIPGTIVGLTGFIREDNEAWYSIPLNSVYDDDNTAIVYAFSRGLTSRTFGGYFRHNETGWTPIEDYIGKRIRLVVFVRAD